MDDRPGVQPFLRHVFGRPDGEEDPSFQTVLAWQIRRGMVATATLGLVGVVVFVGIHLLTGSRPVWIHAGIGDGEVSLADKTFVAAVCTLLLGAARAGGARRWGRALLGVVIVASGLAMALDDVARGDFSFTVGWLVLVQLVAVGTVPLTPRHALSISIALLGVYWFVIQLRPDAISSDLYVHRLAYFLFATVIVVTLSHYLYKARYGQHRALVEAEELRDVLADRSHQLEQSLSDLSTAQAQLVRQERLAALGQFTAGVAHEIQNPLNFVTNFAALNQDLVAELRQATGGGGVCAEDLLDDLSRNAASIQEHGQKASKIVARMLEHARWQRGEPVEVSVNAFVEEHVLEAEERLRRRLGGDRTAVNVRRLYSDEVDQAHVDRRDMGAALLNLLDNAFRAAMEGTAVPVIVVRTARVDDAVEIRIADNGVGIPTPMRDRLFEPFFTTRPPGEGTGLGLSLAYDAVTHGHGGTLTVESEEGRGAVFVVRLPEHPGAPHHPDTPPVFSD